jgi:hypothetical protein
MTDNQVYQSINAISQKVNEVSNRLDNFTLMKYNENDNKIADNEAYISDLLYQVCLLQLGINEEDLEESEE